MKNGPVTSRQQWSDFSETLRAGAPDSPDQGLQTVASALQRPECVLSHSSGRLFVSDQRGGVTTIWPDGRQQLSGHSALLPNGIAMQRDGSFLVANLGPDGGVWRIAPDGQASAWMTEVDGRVIDRVNFVGNDAQDRVWACISATDGSDKCSRVPGHTSARDSLQRSPCARGASQAQRSLLIPRGPSGWHDQRREQRAGRDVTHAARVFGDDGAPAQAQPK
jgi:hypothetical protein